MTNQERQKSLDKKRKREQLGVMRYCCFCTKQNVVIAIGGCWCGSYQEERETHCLCAKAYNRMIREQRK